MFSSIETSRLRAQIRPPVPVRRGLNSTFGAGSSAAGLRSSRRDASTDAGGCDSCDSPAKLIQASAAELVQSGSAELIHGPDH